MELPDTPGNLLAELFCCYEDEFQSTYMNIEISNADLDTVTLRNERNVPNPRLGVIPFFFFVRSQRNRLLAGESHWFVDET